MKSKEPQGARIPLKGGGIQKTLRSYMQSMLKENIVDAILLPMRVPAGDSFAWVLTKDAALLGEALPLAPVMPVQGAKALKSLTRKGRGKLNVAAFMRPCEVRGAVELAKLNQVHLDNITLISVDCPGALPLADYLADPAGGDKQFEKLLSGLDGRDESTKPVCRMCEYFSLLPSVDLHFGFSGGESPEIFLIANSEKGLQVLESLGHKTGDSLESWKQRIGAADKKQKSRRAKAMEEVRSGVEGFDGLLKTFEACIGCHNCQSACPICYCRQCYFDSETSQLDLDFIMLKAERRGALSFPLDKRMFHVGRMSHMSLSCVSCGLCSDACPVDIPVAEVFAFVADHTQKTFEYKAGLDRNASLPIQQYRFEEISGVEKLIKDAEAVEQAHES